MSAITGFIKKEIYHILRDKKTLFALFALPILQLIIFGYAIRNEINNAEIGFLDFSKDNMTTEITNKFLSTDYFKLGADLKRTEDIDSAFKAGAIRVAVVFENNFEDNLYKTHTAKVQIVADGSDPNAARTLIRYAESIIQDYLQGLKDIPNTKLIVEPQVKMLYNPELKSVYGFAPGLIAFILMLITALMTSVAIVKEKELGSMEVLLVSPISPKIIIIGKVLPYLVLAFLDAMAILTIAYFVFGVPFNGSFLLFTAETILYITTTLSLGIFISTVTNSQQSALLIALAGLLMPTVLLSGFIFRIDSMPVVLQILTNALPAKWYLRIVRGIMLKGAGFQYLVQETIVLFGMTVFLLALSVKKFKTKLE